MDQRVEKEQQTDSEGREEARQEQRPGEGLRTGRLQVQQRLFTMDLDKQGGSPPSAARKGALQAAQPLKARVPIVVSGMPASGRADRAAHDELGQEPQVSSKARMRMLSSPDSAQRTLLTHQSKSLSHAFTFQSKGQRHFVAEEGKQGAAQDGGDPPSFDAMDDEHCSAPLGSDLADHPEDNVLRMQQIETVQASADQPSNNSTERNAGRKSREVTSLCDLLRADGVNNVSKHEGGVIHFQRGNQVSYQRKRKLDVAAKNKDSAPQLVDRLAAQSPTSQRNKQRFNVQIEKNATQKGKKGGEGRKQQTPSKKRNVAVPQARAGSPPGHIPVRDLESSHHLALGKMQIDCLQTQANTFAMHCKQRKLSIRHNKIANGSRAKGVAGTGNQPTLQPKANLLNQDILKVQAASPTNSMNESKGGDAAAKVDAAVANDQKSFEIIDSALLSNSQHEHHTIHLRRGYRDSPMTQMMQAEHVDAVNNEGSESSPSHLASLLRAGQSTNRSPMKASYTFQKLNASHDQTSMPQTHMYGGQASHPKATKRGSANHNLRINEERHEVPEVNLDSQMVNEARADEPDLHFRNSQRQYETNEQTEEQQLSSKEQDEKEELGQEGQHSTKHEMNSVWVDHVRAVTIQHDGSKGDAKERLKRSAKENGGQRQQHFMNIHTILMDAQDAEVGQLSREETCLSAEQLVTNLMRIKGADASQLQPGTLDVLDATVKSQRHSAVTSFAMQPFYDAFDRQSRNVQSGDQQRINNSYLLHQSRNCAQEAPMTQSKHTGVVAANGAHGPLQSTVAMTATLPKPQSKPAGGGFSKFVVSRKLDRAHRRMNAEQSFQQATSRHATPDRTAYQMGLKGAIEGEQITVEQLIQKLKYSSSLQKHSRLNKNQQNKKSDHGHNARKTSEPSRPQRRSISIQRLEEAAKVGAGGDDKSTVRRLRQKSSPLRPSESGNTLNIVTSKNNLQVHSQDSNRLAHRSSGYQKKNVQITGDDLRPSAGESDAIPRSPQSRSSHLETAHSAQRNALLSRAPSKALGKSDLSSWTNSRQSCAMPGSPNIYSMRRQDLILYQNQRRVLSRNLKEMEKMQRNIETPSEPNQNNLLMYAALCGSNQINLDLIPTGKVGQHQDRSQVARSPNEGTMSPQSSLLQYLYRKEQHSGAYRRHGQPRILKVIRKDEFNSKKQPRGPQEPSAYLAQVEQDTRTGAVARSNGGMLVKEGEEAAETTYSNSCTADQQPPSPCDTEATPHREKQQCPEDALAATLKRDPSPPPASQLKSQVQSLVSQHDDTAHHNDDYTWDDRGSCKSMDGQDTGGQVDTQDRSKMSPVSSEKPEHDAHPRRPTGAQPSRSPKGRSHRMNKDLADFMKNEADNKQRQTLSPGESGVHRRAKEKKGTVPQIERMPRGEESPKNSVYSPIMDDRATRHKIESKIHELFRQKQPVVRAVTPARHTISRQRDPGVRLAIELAQENAFYIKRPNTSSRTAHSRPTAREARDKAQPAAGGSLLRAGRQHATHQMNKLRQIKALEELAKINNIRLKVNQGMTYEALEQLRRDTYLMSPTVHRPLLQNECLQAARPVEVPPESEEPISTNQLSGDAKGSRERADSGRRAEEDQDASRIVVHPQLLDLVVRTARADSGQDSASTESPLAPTQLQAAEFKLLKVHDFATKLSDQAAYLRDLKSYYTTSPGVAPAVEAKRAKPRAIWRSPTQITAKTLISAPADTPVSSKAGSKEERQSGLQPAAATLDASQLVERLILQKRFGFGKTGKVPVSQVL